MMFSHTSVNHYKESKQHYKSSYALISQQFTAAHIFGIVHDAMQTRRRSMHRMTLNQLSHHSDIAQWTDLYKLFFAERVFLPSAIYFIWQKHYSIIQHTTPNDEVSRVRRVQSIISRHSKSTHIVAYRPVLTENDKMLYTLQKNCIYKQILANVKEVKRERGEKQSSHSVNHHKNNLQTGSSRIFRYDAVYIGV